MYPIRVRRPYLGTDLDPLDYYRNHAESYENPHEEGIRIMLERFKTDLFGTVLDLGCGNGLVTKVLATNTNGPFVGVDVEPAMVERYRSETKSAAFIRAFWDELPPADSAVACYSLHLCPESYLHQVGARLAQAGVQRFLIISPLKRPTGLPCYRLIREETQALALDGKTIYGRLLKNDLD